MAKKVKEETINLDSILFKCRDILRTARNSGSFFEKRDMMLTLVFLRFIGEKFEDGIEKLKSDLIAQGLDPNDPLKCKVNGRLRKSATYTIGDRNFPAEYDTTAGSYQGAGKIINTKRSFGSAFAL